MMNRAVLARATTAILLAAVGLGCDRGPGAAATTQTAAAQSTGQAADAGPSAEWRGTVEATFPAVPAGSQNTFTFINRGDIITMDLNQMSYLQDFRVTYALREGLYKPDPQTLEPKLSIATSATQSDDKKAWTFKLRDDAKWSNGDPVLAKDFVFSWRNMLESPGQYTYLLFYVKNAEAYSKSYREGAGMSFDQVGIRAPDDHTIVVELNDPLPYLPDLMTFPTFYPRNERSMEAFKRVDAKGRVSYDPAYTQPQSLVGNGPYVLKEWLPGQRVVMAKNPTYRLADQIKLDGITMIVSTDPQAAKVQYDNGTIDWMADVTAEAGFAMRAANRKDLHVADAFGTAFLTVNCAPKIPELGEKQNPLADVRVRQALAMTIDKNRIVKSITRMGERPANRYVPAHFYKNWTSATTPEYDVAKAKQLLAEAGFPDGKNFPALSICYNSETPTRKDIAEFLRNQWQKQLGVNIELRAMELKGYRNYVSSKQYSLAMVSWYGDYQDASTWTDKYLSTSDQNDSQWAPPEYDPLLLRATKEPDETKRQALLMQAEGMINTQLPIIPLYYYVNFTMMRDYVHGLPVNARNTTIWDSVYLQDKK